MRGHGVLYIAGLCLVASATLALGPPGDPLPGARALEGSVHDVGYLWLNLTNHNLIGARPGASWPFAGAPSARYPVPDGPDLLWEASLWVGGVVGGERLVSTGSEIRGLPGLDSIHATAHGAPGGTRFPFGDPDDDGDGLEDEDPLNGLDDDGDGLVDEDFAAISDQHFQLVMYDNTPDALEDFPDHAPLNVEVVQRSFQWTGPVLGEFVGFDFTVRNVGAATIADVYLGFHADFDLPAGTEGGADDDLAAFAEMTVPLPELVPIRLAYMLDTPENSADIGLVGVALLGHTTDPAGGSAPTAVGVRAYRQFRDGVPFSQGGDPADDLERYAALSTAGRDPDRSAGQESDYRILLSVGPFPALAPGAELGLQLAIVAGGSLPHLLTTAARAQQAYDGVRYDRDGDPGTGPDGKEHQVHWLPPSRAPTPVASGRIAAELVPAARRLAVGAVRLRLEARHVAAASLLLERTGPARADARVWTAADLFGAAELGGEPLDAAIEVVDSDPAGWPRTYRLLLAGAGGPAHELARLELAAPPAAPGLALAAYPNPFNPLVRVDYRLDRAGPARLTVHDLRGRLVATLLSGALPAGPGSAAWDGRDARGAALPSGTYHLRLDSVGGSATARATLVR